MDTAELVVSVSMVATPCTTDPLDGLACPDWILC